MRKGTNPSKDIILSVTPAMHRVIIPLYIPSEEDYYIEAFKVFKLCLTSLVETADVKISVIADGCCSNVNRQLLQLQEEGQIDELILESVNVGKLNAILKALRTVQESFVTITDADILFVKGWQGETFKLFDSFPKAGVVGLIPQFKLYATLSYNCLYDNYLSKNLQFAPVEDPEALQAFYKSIGWDDTYNKDYLETHLTLSSKDKKATAVVGSGHAVATYRKEVFDHIPTEASKYKLGGDSEHAYLDEPALKIGAWRLTTANNYAYHMGNTLEDWMLATAEKNTMEIKVEVPKQPILTPFKESKWRYFLKNHLFRKYMNKKRFKTFLIKKGLDKKMAEKY